MKNQVMTVVVVFCIAATTWADVAWNAVRAGNPVLPGYFADPSARKFGDTYYLYVTPDGWDVGRGPAGAWSSKDYVNWTFHPMNWPTTEFKWAPSVVEYKGKYYMYTQVPCMIYGAVADTPLGPWKSLSAEGKPMIPDATPKRSIVLDGEAFIDDDGVIYMWYSTWWTPTVAKMKTDMCTIDGTPIQYFKHEGNPNPPYGIVQGCMEAPYMFKRKGIYYLMYSDAFCQDSSYNVKYSTSKSAMGPFTYDASKNPILETSEDGTVDGPGHHTLLVDGDKVYIVYHRHDNPHDPDGAHRQTCIDELYFNEDGSIEKVEPSHLGVGYLAPSTKRDTNLALGKPTTASSSQGKDFGPQAAADENSGTVWKAKDYTFPQWLQIDLGKASPIKRVETEFQYAQVVNSYEIETSSDGKTWQMFANRRENKDVGIMIDKGDVQARYVRVTIHGNNSGRKDQVAAIWNLKVYDGIDKPNQAPKVDLGPERTMTLRFPKMSIEAAMFDDGLPKGPVKVQWAKVSGPGNVAFSHPDRCRTSLTIDKVGTYVVKLTADDGALKGEGSLTIKVAPASERVLQFTFDEDTGAVVKDHTENQCYGVLYKGATRSLGVSGSAAIFDGNDDYLSVKGPGALANLTVATWINVHRVKPELSALVCSEGNTNGDVRLVLDREGKLGLNIGGQQGVVSTFAFSTSDIGVWRHVAVVYDAAAKSATFYVDGKQDSVRQVADGVALNLCNKIRIGGADSGASGFDGELDDVRMYDKAMPAAEIAKLAARTAFKGIADVQKLADGSVVTLMAKIVTLAPADPLTLDRASDFFYIAEPDGTAGIRVQDGQAGQDKVIEDACASLVGVKKTLPSGERYIELTSQPFAGAPRPATALKVSLRSAATAPPAMAALVKLGGKVKELAPDGTWLTLTGDDGDSIKAVASGGKPIKRVAAGNTIEIVGVVGLDGGSEKTRAVMLKSFRRINPPPPPGLAFYSFDENEGDTAKDSSTSGNDATLMNGLVRVPGKSGKAVKFDGDKAFLRLPDLGIQAVMTFAVWMNIEGSGRDNFGSSLLHGDGWTWGDMHGIIPNSSSNFSICVNGGGELRSNAKVYPDMVGKWTHIAIVYDNVNRSMKLYVNGKQDSSCGTGQNKPIDLRSTKVGSWGERDRMFKGLMDEVRIYDRALTDEEISQLAAGKPVAAGR